MRVVQRNQHPWSEASSLRVGRNPKCIYLSVARQAQSQANRDNLIWSPRPGASFHRSTSESRGKGHGAVHLAQAPGIGEAGQHVVTLKPGMSGQHVVHAVAGAQIRKHGLHGNPRVANNRFSIADARNDFNAIHLVDRLRRFERVASRFSRTSINRRRH